MTTRNRKKRDPKVGTGKKPKGNSINLMQGKFKSSQSENKEQKLWVRQKSLPFLKKQKRV